MQHSIGIDSEAVATLASLYLLARAELAIRDRGAFHVALSGGTTPWRMLERLEPGHADWSRWHVFQVDERALPDGDPERNLTRIRRHWIDRLDLPGPKLFPMPVNHEPSRAVAEYTAALAANCGSVPQLDLVFLGLGDDGHTASLVPGDPVLEVADRDVAWTAHDYKGTRRLTLTYPILARARERAWLVTGATKQPMLQRLLARDPSIPAGRLPQSRTVLFADPAAIGDLLDGRDATYS
ncbi:MAG: 6-phosphogluconolactonase [Planctomycetota bacterium]